MKTPRTFTDPKNDNLTEKERQSMQKQFENEMKTTFKKLKKILNAMDFFDLIVYWYEMEILSVWCWYTICTERLKKEMEAKSQFYVDSGNGMHQATDSKLKLHSLYQSPGTRKRRFVQQMNSIRKQAFITGVYSGKKLSPVPFSTFYLRVLDEVRQEIITRFEKHKLEMISR